MLRVEQLTHLLESEGAFGWQVIESEGDEGLVVFEEHIVYIGKDASFGILLHEVAHVLSKAHHYADLFAATLRRLESQRKEE